MPESENRRVLVQQVEKRNKPTPPRSVLGRLTLILLAASASIIGVQLLLYLRTEVQQTLVAAGGVALALVLVIVAYMLLWRQRQAAAGTCLLLAAIIAYASGELAFSGTMGLFVIGGLLVITLVCSVAFPRRWKIWLAASGVHLLLALAINWFEPLPRHDAREIATLSLQLPAVTALLALFALWQLARAIRGIGTIRTRLLIAFVGVVLVPALVIISGSFIGGLKSGQHKIEAQLESVAVLKEAEINTWVENLQFDLVLALTGDEVMRRAIVLLERPDDPSTLMLADSVVRTRFEQVIEQTGRFDALSLLNLDGEIVLSTDPSQEGEMRSSQVYFREGLKGPYVQRPFYSLSQMRSLVMVAQPVKNYRGEVLGVVTGQASLAALNEIMAERTGLGETGETYLVGANSTLLTPTRSGEANVWVSTEGIDQALKTQSSGSGLYANYRGKPVVGAYRWLPQLQAALLAEQEQAEAFAAVYMMLGIVGSVALASVVFAGGLSLLITRSIAAPLASLAETATQVAAGDLTQEARVEREDEIGTLAQAFNSMTAQLRNLIGSLEQRVADRTRDLEQRSRYLQASAEVGHAASSILAVDQLIQQVVELIREQFSLYYVGLFLVGEAGDGRGGEWAVLRAGAGQAGQTMLARGHRYRIGEGMVGWCIAHAQPRVALDIGKDAVRLATPELPDTRSEAALPLRSRGRVLGALTVQHTEPAAFDQDTVMVLQTMADQVAVALDNARLFAERQAALDAAQRAYGELSRQAWWEMLRTQSTLGYRSDAAGVAPAGDVWRPEMELAVQRGQTIQGDGSGGERSDEGRLPLAVPIKVRGEVIGVLDTYKPAEAGGWTADETALLETLADQLSAALENARLHQEAQRRAMRERLINEITAQLGASLDPAAILQIAIRELGQALGAAEVIARLRTETGPSKDEAKTRQGGMS